MNKYYLYNLIFNLRSSEMVKKVHNSPCLIDKFIHTIKTTAVF